MAKKINYKSDFDFFLDFGEEGGVPPYDFRCWIYTDRTCGFEVSKISGVYKHCFEDGGHIHVVADNHGLAPGVLMCEATVYLPNSIYPDGSQRIFDPFPLGIELARGRGDDLSGLTAAQLMPPYIIIKGDPFTYDDYTPEQIEDLQRPAKEAARRADTAASEANAAAERANAAANGITKELEEKASKTDLSNIVGIPTGESIEDIDPTLVTEALRKVPQTLTPKEQAQVKKNIGISEMKLFCDMLNAAVGTDDYARITDGEFDCELNKLKLTYEEAIDIYNACIGIKAIGSDKADCLSPYPYRTALPIQRRGATTATNFFNDSPNLEVVALFGKNNIPFIVNRWDGMFARCPKLHTVNGVIDVSKANIVGEFYDCQALKEIRIRGVVKSFSIQYSPLLSLASVDYMVMNAANTSPVTITVHPDVYAKLTDESNTEWNAVLTAAATKNITFATI